MMTRKARLRLDRICAQGGDVSYSEVVRRAIALYDLALEVERGKGAILIRRESGDIERVVLEY